MKRITKALSLLLSLLLLATWIPVLPAAAQTQPMVGGYYKLVNKATGLVLTETDDNSYTPSVDTRRVAVKEDADEKNQVWTLTAKPDGMYGIVSCDEEYGLHKTQEMDSRIEGSSFVLTLTTANQSPEQVWKLVEMEDGYYRIDSNYTPGQCLAATDFSLSSDVNTLEVSATPIEETTDDSQLWQFVETLEPDLGPLPDIDPIYPLDPVEPQQPAAPYLQERVQPGNAQLTGYVNDVIEYIEENQLKTTDWKNLATMFKDQMDADFAFRGEFWGKLMRGACLSYQYTQDEELYQVLENSAQYMLRAQDELGRLSTYPVHMEFRGWDMWCRKYALIGLESFYEICRDQELKDAVLKAMCLHTDYIISKLGPREEGKTPINETSSDWEGMPSSSILEPVVNLYEITGYQRYLDFATYIVEEGGSKSANIFQLAYENEMDPYQYLKDNAKAYEMTSCFEGLAEYARITGSEKWKAAVVNYCKKVAAAEITITGSGGGDGIYNSRISAGEQWNKLAEEQTDPNIQHMQETCVTVTWIKLCEKVLRMTDDPTLVDEIEKSVYNALFGAIKGPDVTVTGGAADYLWDYFSLLSGTRNNDGGGHLAGLNSCCPANGPSAPALIPFIQVMNSASGPVVNLYNPGTTIAKAPSGQDVAVKLDTEYPKNGDVRITVSPDSAERFILRLRIPSWSGQTTVQVNGEAGQTVQAGTYFAIDREWNPGDTIQITFDMRVKAVESPQGHNSDAGDYTALVYGPLVLARDARFGEGSMLQGLKIATDEEGYAVATASDTGRFQNLVEFVVETTDGRSFHVTDYASAGSTWDMESEYTVWIPTDTIKGALEEGKPYLLLGESSGLPITADLATGNVYQGAEIFSGEQKNAQIWVFERGENGAYRVRNEATGLYLAIDPDNVGNVEANAQLEEYRQGATNQLWRMTRKDGNYSFVNVASGQCLSESGETDNIHQWVDVDSPLQRWTLTLLEEPAFEMTAEALDENGNPISSMTVNEMFKVRVTTDGDVSAVRLYNESGIRMGLREMQATENADGTVTWTFRTSIGTVGNGRILRVFTVAGNGAETQTDAALTLDIVPLTPVIFSASIEEHAVVNQPVELKIITNKAASGIEIYNSNGLKMGIMSAHYEDTEQGRVWTVQIACGTYGTRAFTVYAKEPHGTKSEAAVTNEVNISLL